MTDHHDDDGTPPAQKVIWDDQTGERFVVPADPKPKPNTMPQWIIDLATAQDLRDADQQWRHRSWKLINRMHTTINDLRDEIKWQRHNTAQLQLELDTAISKRNRAMLKLAGQDTPRPPAVHPDSTLGPVWFVSEADLDRIVAGGVPLFTEAAQSGDYVYSVARLRSGGWGEVHHPTDNRYDQITADYRPNTAVEDYIL